MIKEKILEAGLKLWRSDPSKVNPHHVARMIGKTRPAIYYYFKNTEDLKKAVAAYGIEQGDSVVIVGLMLTDSPLVKDLTEAERRKHLSAVKLGR